MIRIKYREAIGQKPKRGRPPVGRLFHKCLKDCFSKRFDMAAQPEVYCQHG
jgi:hypothetical protein